MENLYDVLHCQETATHEELKRRYQELALKYHPDKTDGKKEYTAQFVKVNKAWKILGDPILREQFDARWNERCLTRTWPIQEEVDSSEFIASDREKQFEEINGSVLYSYNCRCGGEFLLSSADIEMKFDIVCCDTCSLAIKIMYENDT